MTYSDDVEINHDIELLLYYFEQSPYVAVGQTPPPAKTRAEIIETIRAEHGDWAASSVRITVH
ncbi:hypothetical protein [Bradyrhizobium sp. SZCCHNR1093]|uniref:hypothetical protein n=1 Tax=Bradyrhizobium sp. SZCCHNR1093 TaxID=3057368 RepID=UPI0028EE8492|nr:hypothetical protein [Bradyrhizobium sp. SZCCHNR1093]